MKRYLLFSLFCSILVWSSCIQSPSGREQCIEIETARCELRHRCKSNFDVEGCKFYYAEQCRARKIKVSYSVEQLETCVSSIDSFGEESEECERMFEVGLKSELCEFSEFSECASFLCGQEDDKDEDEDEDEDEDVSSGLNP